MKKKKYAYLVESRGLFPVGEPIPLHCGFERDMSRRHATSGEAHNKLCEVLESRSCEGIAGLVLKRKSGGRWYVVHVVEK